ncbi:MAG: hypothetical protein EXR77_10290 [Myxococcales bacterium]|nr:hypothetical protein [Myxococcales bacterium]
MATPPPLHSARLACAGVRDPAERLWVVVARTQKNKAVANTYALLAAVFALAGCDGEPQPASSPVAAEVIAAQIGDVFSTADIAVDAAEVKKDANRKTWLPPQPAIIKVWPDEGPSGGLQTVTIEGENLDAVTQVRFGESPAVSFEVMNSTTIVAVTPPRPPAIVEVAVHSFERPDAVLPQAYRFVANMAIFVVTPAHGPTTGGTAVVVTGAGFAADTQFVFGDRAALQVVVVDEVTAMLVTPPNGAGTFHVRAAGGDGQALLKKGFSYHAPPTLTSAWPAVGPVEGETLVTLTGEGLEPNTGKVQFYQKGTQLNATVVSAAGQGAKLVVKAPAAWAAGVWSIRFIGIDGTAELSNAYAFVNADEGTKIGVVSPNGLAVNEIVPVTLGLSGPLTANNLAVAKVAFGGIGAKILQVNITKEGAGLGASLLVLPSAPSTGPLPAAVDVSVQFGPALIVLPNAFEWQAPTARIATIAPVQVAVEGGTAVQLTVEAAQQHGGVVALKLGALSASQLKVLTAKPNGDHDLVAVAPPGTAGFADVAATLGDGTLAKWNSSAQFVSKITKLYAVVPGKGAKSGGTYAIVVGQGLHRVASLTLGGIAVKSWKILHNGAIELRTPPHAPGAVPLAAVLDTGATADLSHAFTYFDPVSVENGSWGDPIDGALNVTVLRKGKIGPVPGATVIIGDDPKTALQGLTDAQGQITLSTAHLTGPLHVHAAKVGWSAASAIALGVENITLRLQEFPPVQPGIGSPNPQEPVPPPGMVSVTVVDAAKYTVFPLGTCKGQPDVNGQCQPCNETLLCATGTTCETVQAPLASAALPIDLTATTGQKYCLAACKSQADCAPNYECRALGPDLAAAVFRCAPRIGVPQIRCEGTGFSIFGGAPKSPADGIAQSDGKATVAINPGDAAVVCRSGYLDKKTGEFVPLAIGVTRKLFAIPGQKLKNVVVSVHVPLDRSVRVRMDRIPMGPDATGLRQLNAGLDLGAEGYIPLGSLTTYAVTDTLQFERQPAHSLWAGENADIRYEFYGGLSQAYGAAPSSNSQATDVDPRGLDRYAVLGAGAINPLISEVNVPPIRGLAAAGELRVAVGDRGAILHWTGGTFTPQASPVSADLMAVWLDPAGTGDGWIGGVNGVLIRRTQLGWKAWAQTAPRSVVAMAGRGPQDVWLVDSASQLMHFDGLSWQTVAGPWPVVSTVAKNDAKPPPKQLRALWQAATGALYLAGDGGVFVRLSPVQQQSAAPKYESLNSGTALAINGLWGDSQANPMNTGADTVWLAGDLGYLGLFDGQNAKPFNTVTTQPLFAIRGAGGLAAVDVVGGQGTWLRVHLNGAVDDLSEPDLRVDLKGVLPMFDGGRVAAGLPVVRMGPYLEMPWLQSPALGQPVLGETGSYRVTWTANPGVEPTFNLVRIADAGYNTRWEIFLRGSAMSADLPNFAMLGAGTPLPGGTNYVRMWRILAPGTEIDSFSTKNLTNSRWISWSYNVRSTAEPPVMIPVPTAVEPAKVPNPWQIPGWPPK